MRRPPLYSKKRLEQVKEQLEDIFNQGQGLIMGDSAVVSRKAHLEPRCHPGMVHIHIGKDAGKNYIGSLESDKIIHIDVFHQPAMINIEEVANRIRDAVYRYLHVITPNSLTSPEEEEMAVLNLARRIQLVTGEGDGTAQHPRLRVNPSPGRRNSHVHILANLEPIHFSFVDCIIKETEKAITHQGIMLRPIRQIIHIHPPKNHLECGACLS